MLRTPRWISLVAIALATLALTACDDEDAGTVDETDLIDTADDTSTPDTGDDTAEPDDTADTSPDDVPTDTVDETAEPDTSDVVEDTDEDATDTAPDITDVILDTADTTVADTTDTTDATDTADEDVMVEPCGDGMVDTANGETCDIAITSGPGACPTTCSALDTCQPRMLTGTACTAACVDDAPITTCINDDGCCASTCDGLDNDCMQARTSYRLSTITMQEPALWFEIGACTDITQAATGLINQSMSEDSDTNGYLDLSFVVDFQPLDTTATAPRNLGFGGGNCTAPVAGTTCTPNSAFPLVQTTYLNGPAAGATTCLDVLPGTAASTVIVTPTSPCFSTQEIDIQIDFAGVTVPLTYARVGGRYATAGGLDEGLIYGFIDETTAENVIFPASVQLIGGRSLASLLGGGTGSCQQAQDTRDTLPDGTVGWWFYLNYDAAETTYTP